MFEGSMRANDGDEVFESDLSQRLSRDFLGREKCNVGSCCFDLHWHDSHNYDDEHGNDNDSDDDDDDDDGNHDDHDDILISITAMSQNTCIVCPPLKQYIIFIFNI